MESENSKPEEELPSTTENAPKSMVYSREEYAKKEFWDDRFTESNG